MTDEPLPPIAKPEDLGHDLAVSAYRWTSHTPEDRARRDQQSYADDVNGLHAEMLKHATTDEQKALVAEEMQRYKENYLKHFGAYLTSHSSVASSMITGPANVPVRQQQKRGQAADNKGDEFLQWREKARAAIERKVLDSRPQSAKDDERWNDLSADIKRSLAEIRAIDEQGSPWNRSSFVNSIAGKVERLAEAGETALVDRAVAQVREYNDAHRKPAISSRHGFWALPEFARQKAEQHDAAISEEPSTIVESDGIRIVENKAADRVQIFFPGKPDDAMRAKLKGEAWNWSRTEGAWQRKLTNAAIHSAKKITGLPGSC